MADNGRANELNRRLRGQSWRNVSTMDENLRAIERFVREAAAEDVGVLSVYRALDEREKAELSQTEADEIANAYRAEVAGDDTPYFITYKPKVEKGKGKGTLEHLNRSTPFVQMLLDKVENEFSFLYCHSTVQNTRVPLPDAANGFTVTAGQREHLEGKNKYELFFLIECKDNIDGEKITNVLDSVLLDVDGGSGDFFSRMSYASLDHMADDEDDVPQVDIAVQRQLNGIIKEIRENASVRQRILDFLTAQKESELYAHLAARNEAFVAARAMGGDVNVLNSTVTCRMLPIGVFLNEIDNDRITYTVTGTHGESATFCVELNPTKPFRGHVCPRCGKPLSAYNGAVAVDGVGGYAVGCESCASKCSHKNCHRYSFDDEGCAVCALPLCAEHAHRSMDSDARLCDECVQVFRDSASGEPLAPVDAAVRGCEEDYVQNEVGRLGKTGVLNRFKTVKLLRKSQCARCKTVAAGREYYTYYPQDEAEQCGACGEYFFRGDMRRVKGTGTFLCAADRVDCACGNVVEKDKAHMCAASGCGHGFCDDCYRAQQTPHSYASAVKLLAKKKIPLLLDDKTYCADHAAVCKVCGRAVPLPKAHMCSECGGITCEDCREDGLCRTCAAAKRHTASSKMQTSALSLSRRNALRPKERYGKYGIFEDHENIVFVTYHYGKKRTRNHNKLTGRTDDVTE